MVASDPHPPARTGSTLGVNHENHEGRIMVAPLARSRLRGDHALRNATRIPAQVDRPAHCSPASITSRRLAMQWTTPTASDFRFGFEITMYVSAR